MKNDQLLKLLNETKDSEDVLKQLSSVNFKVTDRTEEGDSVLHVLAQTNHVNSNYFYQYLKKLMGAGADPNLYDRTGCTFIYYYKKNLSYSFGAFEVFRLLFKGDNFDVNQKVNDQITLFELLIPSGFTFAEIISALLHHKEFNPNQKTSKHNSVMLHMLAECQAKENLVVVAQHPKFNPNIRNNNGQTAAAAILADNRYKDMKVLLRGLINHDQSDINVLDNDGNNYLQLVLLSSVWQHDEIAELLIKKNINLSHKNNDGKSVFDIIAENKAHENSTLLIYIIVIHPASLFVRYLNGKTVLTVLLQNGKTYRNEFKRILGPVDICSIAPATPTFCGLSAESMDPADKPRDVGLETKCQQTLELCKTSEKGLDYLKEAILECFTNYNHTLEVTLISLIRAMAITNTSVGIEYLLALVAVRRPAFHHEALANHLKTLKPKFDCNEVIRHVNNLTKENSDERLMAMNEFLEYQDIELCDEAQFAFEECAIRKKNNTGIGEDSKMFGHLFSLSGSVPVNESQISLTVTTSNVTAPFMSHLMNAYVSHCEQTGKHKDYLGAIKQVRNMTIKAMRYNIGRSKVETQTAMLEDSKRQGVEVITGWPEHQIVILIRQDDFYRNNGGGCSTDATTEHYKITKPEQLTEAVFKRLCTENLNESNKKFIQQELHELLGLKFVGTMSGTFQTVGNCTFESRRIALKPKYRLVLPEAIADEIYIDTLGFFEDYYLKEYTSRYSNSPTLPHILMRLITQKLIPSGLFEQAAQLLKDHFKSAASQEIMQVELMLHAWELKNKGKPLEQFNSTLQAIKVVINPEQNKRLYFLDRLLNDQISSSDIDKKTFPLNLQAFQSYHLIHIAVVNDNLALVAFLMQLFPEAVNLKNWFGKEPLSLVKSVAMIDLLVSAGAKTNNTDNDNALDHAIRENRPDLVHALIKRGMKPSEYSAYYAATKDPQILKSLIEHFPLSVSKKTHDYRTAAHAAACSGHSANLHTLVYYGGSNPAESDVNGVTPLQLALRNGHGDAVRLLIECPGTLFAAPYRGDSVVAMAKTPEMKRLIESKEQQRERIDTSILNKMGKTAADLEGLAPNLKDCVFEVRDHQQGVQQPRGQPNG